MNESQPVLIMHAETLLWNCHSHWSCMACSDINGGNVALFESGGWSTWSASIDGNPSKLAIGTDNIYTAATDEARRLINVEPTCLECVLSCATSLLCVSNV